MMWTVNKFTDPKHPVSQQQTSTNTVKFPWGVFHPPLFPYHWAKILWSHVFQIPVACVCSYIIQLCHWNGFCVSLSLAAFSVFFKLSFFSFALFFKQSAMSLLQKWHKRFSTLSLHGWLPLFCRVEAEMIGPSFQSCYFLELFS